MNLSFLAGCTNETLIRVRLTAYYAEGVAPGPKAPKPSRLREAVCGVGGLETRQCLLARISGSGAKTETVAVLATEVTVHRYSNA